MADKCPDCGAPVGGREECQKLFDEVMAREFSSPALFSVHRTTVDCYALQHPERYCASFKSFAAHLTDLYCTIEHGNNPAMLRAVHVGLNGRHDRARPPFVEDRGEITIQSVYDSADAVSHRKAVEVWARCVWRAWPQYHDFARELLREMMASAQLREKTKSHKK